MTDHAKGQAPVAIGSDHAGYEYKAMISKLLAAKGLAVADKGPDSSDSVDYPDYAHPVAEMVAGGAAAAGVLICGSGNGVCMAANKHAGVRAALCWTAELAALARQHNDANVLCLPARFISAQLAAAITETFFATSFEGGRHQKRVDKI